MIVYWNNFHGSLSHHWLNVPCLLLTEGWCYLRDLSSGASFLVWHCSALTGSRVWVPPTESETTNHHKDRNREAVSTEISPSSEIGVQGWHHIEIHKWLTEFHCCIWTSPWLERACWHVCASYTPQYSAWQCWTGWRLGSAPQSSKSQRNWCPANNCRNTRSKVNQSCKEQIYRSQLGLIIQ